MTITTTTRDDEREPPQPRHSRLQAPTLTPSAAFRKERPWCGWLLAFADGSDADTATIFGLNQLKNISVLLTTADGRSRPVKILDPQADILSDDDELCQRGIEVTELETEDYEPMTPERRERVRYEDIRELVVF